MTYLFLCYDIISHHNMANCPSHWSNITHHFHNNNNNNNNNNNSNNNKIITYDFCDAKPFLPIIQVKMK